MLCSRQTLLTFYLQIERRLAPFWRGLNDFSESWIEHQLVAAARGLPIPPPDEVPPELVVRAPKPVDDKEASNSRNIDNSTVPITSRSHSFNSDGSQGQPLPSPVSQTVPGTSSSPFFRNRAKTLAAITTSLKPGAQVELAPREIQLPYEPFFNGQAIEAYLYKDACECPICFLYYPPYLNHTRCCDQPICSECFVQIKRPDPHPPEHGESSQNAEPGAENEQSGSGSAADCQLVSEPSACPFCVQPEFGVTYIPPPFRRGLAYANDQNTLQALHATSSLSSNSSLSSGNAPQTANAGRRRGASLSTTDPAVVTTDKIRPDWAQKLANARTQASRRAAAATALHTAAYIANSNGTGSVYGGLNSGRRSGGRRTGGGEVQGNAHRMGSPALNALAFLTERRGTGHDADNETGNLAPPRGSSRRTRLDDLEEMMMMEAVRLSLASEEERRKKVEKEAKKDAKKREKDAKKAEKVSRRNGPPTSEPSSSPPDASTKSKLGEVASSSSSVAGDETSSAGKGKGVDRTSPSATSMSIDQSSAAAFAPLSVNVGEQGSLLSSVGQPSPTEPSKQSHLRQVSSASSSLSSLVEQNPDERSSTDGNNASLEPMFNFRSLAAVIGDKENDENPEHVEDTTPKEAEGSTSNAAPSENQDTTVSPSRSEDNDDITPLQQTAAPHESRECVVPKELETSSIEITNPTSNTETAS